ncbi:hypothetical protein ISKNV_00027 [Infectious spleen and kidney necrosis virus]|nr:hypothetical protein ISKNV_00027 [Infectious spleen and kidney necrosis virus]
MTAHQLEQRPRHRNTMYLLWQPLKEHHHLLRPHSPRHRNTSLKEHHPLRHRNTTYLLWQWYTPLKEHHHLLRPHNRNTPLKEHHRLLRPHTDHLPSKMKYLS